MRQGRAVGDGVGVVGQHAFGQGWRIGQRGEVDGAEAAVFERSDVGGRVFVVELAGVGPGAFAFAVGDVEGFAVGGERDGAGVPASRDVFEDLHGSGVEDGYGVD